MKRTIVLFIIALIAVLIIPVLLTGCGNDPGNGFEPPEFVYQPEVIPFPLPEGEVWIDHFTMQGDSVYFVAMGEWNEGDTFTSYSIYRMDLDGTNTRALPNYDVTKEYPADAENGSVQIYSIAIDRSGNIWIAERGEFFNMREGEDEDHWERWVDRTIVKEFTRVRKLDDTGAELLSVDISHVSKFNDWFYISAFAVDSEDNIYIGTDSTIHVFDSNGGARFSLDVQWVERLVNLQDGSVAHSGWGGKGRELLKIDVAGKKFVETISLPDNAHNVYQGNDEYSLIFSDNIGLYGIEESSGESVMLLDWIESDMSQDGLRSITILPDGRLLVISQTWGADRQINEIIYLTKTPYSELPERTILTLATFYLDGNIRSEVVKFNRASTTHRIRVTDYSEFNTEDDWQAGLTRLSTEIITGNVPDLLDVRNLPFTQYAAKDLLLDLYTLIDSDSDFDRSDFIESAFRAAEINGDLYLVFPSFSIITMIGHPSVVGSSPGWTMEEFVAMLASHPNADYPLGQGLTSLNFLQALFMFNMNDYVDWDAGTTRFDSSDFIALLEYAKTFPDEYIWDTDYIPTHELIMSGRQVVYATSFWSIDDYQMSRAMFGGDIVYKGLPTENRNGNSLSPGTAFAITSKCKDVDGAWSFIRTFLIEDWQKDNIWYGLPTNRHVFDKLIHDALTVERGGSASIDGFLVEMEKITQADVDQIMSLVNSVSGTVGQDDTLWTIISESAADFFSGRSSVQDAVRVIQNRASIYVAEQS